AATGPSPPPHDPPRPRSPQPRPAARRHGLLRRRGGAAGLHPPAAGMGRALHPPALPALLSLADRHGRPRRPRPGALPPGRCAGHGPHRRADGLAPPGADAADQPALRCRPGRGCGGEAPLRPCPSPLRPAEHGPAGGGGRSAAAGRRRPLL
ncbi:MAG: hypothetical protein AVDCRST_MAG27-4222, partial [uncultured Craurococcus sp.]